jgi:2-oxoglutarate dehydrogenase E1 component
MLLPHGNEGQGPEHSSARPERYLQLCAGTNMQVVNCSTPGNYFHALRRQLKRDFTMPLIVMTPKSLLRHPKCVSTLDELATGNFQELIDDTNVAKKVRKVLFCTGKIYYELLAEKEAKNATDIAIVRIEQLYPLPEWKLTEIFAKYEGAEFCWVQEESKNQGTWLHLHRYDFPVKLTYVGRRKSARRRTSRNYCESICINFLYKLQKITIKKGAINYRTFFILQKASFKNRYNISLVVLQILVTW